jgi:hypothetical protein
VLFTAGLLVVGGGAVWLWSSATVHQDAATVPSTAGAHSDRSPLTRFRLGALSTPLTAVAAAGLFFCRA